MLFGDGVGAVVLDHVETGGFRGFELGADGGGGMDLFMPGGGSRQPATHESVDRGDHLIHMNGREVFKLPVYELGTPVPVPGIDGLKMSKSHDNTIPILAPAKQLKARVMLIKTDGTPLEAPKDPDTCNVMALYKLVASPEEVAILEVKYRNGGYGHGHAKLDLLAALEERFGAARERYNALMQDRASVDKALAHGALRARAVARQVTDRAREATGLR